MKLSEKLLKAQNPEKNNHKKYCKNVYNIYNEFITIYFHRHSPFTAQEKITPFVSSMDSAIRAIAEQRLPHFKWNKGCSEEELEQRLFLFFQKLACSVLDRSLIRLICDKKNIELSLAALEKLKEKYKPLIEPLIYNRIKNNEWRDTEKFSGYELEEYWKKASHDLLSKFLEKKLDKILKGFDINNNYAIFRNYIDTAIKNFLKDYFAGKDVKRKRRLELYREELSEDFFELLKNLKGHGNLFYYKKKSDSLSIRDTGKALSVIRKLDANKGEFKKIERLFTEKVKRAKFQRFIDNTKRYIRENCPDRNCPYILSSREIKALLFYGDELKKQGLAIKEEEISRGSEKLKKCVVCLNIKRQ